MEVIFNITIGGKSVDIAFASSYPGSLAVGVEGIQYVLLWAPTKILLELHSLRPAEIKHIVCFSSYR